MESLRFKIFIFDICAIGITHTGIQIASDSGAALDSGIREEEKRVKILFYFQKDKSPIYRQTFKGKTRIMFKRQAEVFNLVDRISKARRTHSQ